MRDSIQCLGWYVRRTPDVPAIGRFFHDVIGLPHLRPDRFHEAFATKDPTIYVLWGGETMTFEVMQGGTPAPAYTDPVQAPAIPVFRAHGLDGLIQRLTAAGVRILTVRDEPLGRTAYVFDPLGHLTAFRETPGDSTLPQDVEALRRWDAGETRMPGVDPLPADLQDMAWVILNVVDVAKQTAFYRDVIGLDVVREDEHGTLLSIGDTAILEIRPGGTIQPIPEADRAEVNEMWMIRTRDLPALVADLDAAGVHWVNRPWELTGGVLAYCTDPEGHLLGIQDHPLDPEWVEEVEAWRRWNDRATVGSLS